MSNMSYCRFRNTLADLRDCQEALFASVDPFDDLSDDEKKAAKRLIALCKQIAEGFAEDDE